MLWLKAFHVVAVISWMAGLLYLPRLFVYHASASPGSELAKTLETMEARLMRVIMLPAMLAVWVSGPLLAYLEGVVLEPWLIAKVLLVVALTGFHGMAGRWRKDFAAGRNTRPEQFYRAINEVPTLLMIVIVVLVLVKPF